MPDTEFLFSLALSGGAFDEEMVNEVARSVLKSLGYAGAPADVTNAVDQVVAACGRDRCEIRFQAHAGTLNIAVSPAGRPSWHTAITLPHS